MPSQAHKIEEHNPHPWQYSERQRAEVCSSATARLFGETSAHACVSLALVVMWSGQGPRRLRMRVERALVATARAIKRGGSR